MENKNNLEGTLHRLRTQGGFMGPERVCLAEVQKLNREVYRLLGVLALD